MHTCFINAKVNAVPYHVQVLRKPSGPINSGHLPVGSKQGHIYNKAGCPEHCVKPQSAMKHRHENDALSVGRLVQELGTKVVPGYNPQGVVEEAFPKLTEERFLLFIMTDFQAEMFEKHSSPIVCINSTHKTNPYELKLDMYTYFCQGYQWHRL